jgi:photosystem II stability/assembly factor-like uncharacterized protein
VPSVWWMALCGSVVLSCSDSSAPTPARECDWSTSSGWTHLGLEGRWVTALAETPWGIFAGTGYEGVYVLNADSGAWQSVGLDRSVISAMAYVPGATPRLLVGVTPHDTEQTTAAVFATEDRGRIWLPSDGGLADRNGNRQWAEALTVDPGDPTRLYMGQSGSILRSVDGGRSWEYVDGSPDMMGAGFRSIVISRQRDGHVWAGGGGALFNSLIMVSEDWGDSWDPIIPTGGFENTVFALGVDETNPKRLWAGLYGGVMRSDDGGSTWKWVDGVDEDMVMSILVTRERVYAVGGRFHVADAFSDLALFCSANGGTTWSAVTVPAGVPGSDVAVLDAQGRLLIGTVQPQGGVWRFVP